MFISVKEAMELTGMSSTTIYRLCNKRINTLYVRKEDNKFLIDKEFILATFPPDIVAMNQDFEPEKNAIVQPEIEKIQIEKSNLHEPLFILESEEESSPILEAIESARVDENFRLTEEYKLSETSNLNKNSVISDMDKEPLQLITVSKNPIILANNEEKKEILNQKEILKDTEIKKSKTFNWEALVGISVSLIVVGILIYLVYLDVH